MSLLPLKILGDGSSNLILEKDLNLPPVLGYWAVNDIPFIEDSIENKCLQSRDIMNSTWLVSGGSKIQQDTIKSPCGTYDVPLVDLASLGLLYQDISLGAGTWTVSFYVYTTHQNIIATAIPDSDSDSSSRKYVDIIGTNRWQKVSQTVTLSGTETVRVLIETRTGNAQGTKPTLTGFGAFTDFQVEESSYARTRVPTTTTAVTRASSVANGACFHVRATDIGKEIKFIPYDSYVVAKKQYKGKFFIAVWGQSNVFYQWKLDRAKDFITPRGKQVGRRLGYFGTSPTQALDGVVLNLDNPCHFHETLTGNNPTLPDPNQFDRYDTSFIAWLANYFCDDLDIEVVFFPEARGGTGFTTDINGDSWLYNTGTLYDSMITRIDDYVIANPDAKCIGLIGSDQELDIFSSMSWSTYKGHLIDLYDDFRGRSWCLHNNIPIIHVPFSNSWTLGTASLKAEYFLGLKNLGSEVTNYFFIDTSVKELVNNISVNVYKANSEKFTGATDTTHYSKEAGYKIAKDISDIFKGVFANDYFNKNYLGTLKLSNYSVDEDSFDDVLVGYISGHTCNSTLSLEDDAGGRFKIIGNGLYTSSTNIDYEVNPTCEITIRETKNDKFNSPKDTTITININDTNDLYVRDTFTGTSGTSILNHIGDLNSEWTPQSGYTPSTNAELSANGLVNKASSNVYRTKKQSRTANYEVYAKFINKSSLSSDNVGIMGRCRSDENTQYFVRFVRSSNTWGLFKTLAGVATQLGSNYSDAWSVADEIREVILKMDGTSIDVFIDGVSRISASNSDIQLKGYGGIRLASTASQSSTTGILLQEFEVRELS